MNIIGLKGFSSLGVIDQHFRSGFFPRKFNWTRQDVDVVLGEYYQVYGAEPYVAICYSDGGTVGHRLFMADTLCKGLIAVGSTFPSGLQEFMPLRNFKPVLLVSNAGDLTGMGFRTSAAYKFYSLFGFPTIQITTRSVTWHKHDFAPALPHMKQWCRDYLEFDLPLVENV